jgi:hypothetical protein
MLRSVAAVALVALPLVVEPRAAWAETSGPSTTEKDLTTCINSNPKPGCGVAPAVNGDRGSAAQYTVFAVMVAGLVVIGAVVVRSTRRTTKAREAMAARGSPPAP